MAPTPLSVCLFCGSRPGNRPEFIATGQELGQKLAAAGHRLVYGAGDRGLMGETARAMQLAGGHVTGVIPQHLVDAEIGKTDVDDYIVTDNMHQRKMLMFERSDAVVTLPGGPGTLDELIEVLTWRQLGLHAKPVVLINVGGYWDPLIALLRSTIDHGFADESFLEFLTVVPDAGAAVDALGYD
ncbi:MAG: TIGR00730 family Rossman fold protein [Pseudomonadota bacterium]